MRPTAQIHEVAAMRFLEVNERFSQRELTCEQAAEVMGVSVSTFYRKRQRFAEEGTGGLVDRRIGKISARRVPVDEAMRVIALFETQYYDFTVKHFHEKLVEQAGSFSSHVPHNPERLVLVLCKDFHALNDIGAASQAEQCESRIAQGCKALSFNPVAHPDCIFSKSAISHIMKSIFDSPMSAHEAQQA
jgi:hypothetical protein